MANVKGWDTKGVSQLATLDDGRVVLTFLGTDGDTRNVFVNAASLPPLVGALIALNAQIATPAQSGSVVPSANLQGVKHYAIGSDDAGTEFALALTTSDGLELRFLLDPNTARALATSLAGTLEKHGKFLPPEKSGA